MAAVSGHPMMPGRQIRCRYMVLFLLKVLHVQVELLGGIVRHDHALATSDDCLLLVTSSTPWRLCRPRQPVPAGLYLPIFAPTACIGSALFLGTIWPSSHVPLICAGLSGKHWPFTGCAAGLFIDIEDACLGHGTAGGRASQHTQQCESKASGSDTSHCGFWLRRLFSTCMTPTWSTTTCGNPISPSSFGSPTSWYHLIRACFIDLQPTFTNAPLAEKILSFEDFVQGLRALELLQPSVMNS